MRSSIHRVALLVIGLLATASHAGAQLTATPQFFQVGPTATYLRTGDLDAPSTPTIIFLGSGVSGELLLQPTGSYSVAGPTQTGKFWAVFSSTNTLLPNNGVLNRVPGAIDIGSPLNSTAITAPSFYGAVPMDIAQDFFVPDAGLAVIVPNGAQYLFVGTPDSFFADNSTPNPATLGLHASITAPEPATVAMLACGLVSLLAAARRRRKAGLAA